MFKFMDYFSHKHVSFERTRISFYNCILKKDIGDFRAGHFFAVIEFICASGLLELCFYDENNNMIMVRGFDLIDTPMSN